MSREEYLSLTDDELANLMETGDSEAGYYLQIRHKGNVFSSIPKTCGKYTADVDYYGTPEGGNR